MRTLINALFIAIVLCSCSADVKTESVSQEPDQQASHNVKETSQLVSQTNEKDGSFNSLIGKNTAKVESMGWYICAATVIDSPEDTISYAVSQLTKSQKECRNGKGKVVLEKILYRNKGKAIHEIIDEINIDSNYPEKEYSWTTCNVGGAKSEKIYLIGFKDQRQAELTEIYNLWKLDLKVGKFVKVKNLKGVTCINPDYSEGL